MGKKGKGSGAPGFGGQGWKGGARAKFGLGGFHPRGAETEERRRGFSDEAAEQRARVRGKEEGDPDTRARAVSETAAWGRVAREREGGTRGRVGRPLGPPTGPRGKAEQAAGSGPRRRERGRWAGWGIRPESPFPFSKSFPF